MKNARVLRPQSAARYARLRRRFAWVTFVVLAMLSLVPSANAQEVGSSGFPLPDVASWFSGSQSYHWSGLPHESSGSAAGTSHVVSAAATRSGAGAGHPRGKGQGELAPYAPATPKSHAGSSATARTGFNRATSKEIPAKRAEKSKTYLNADGSTSVEYFGGRVNYQAADGSMRPIDPTLVADAGGRLHKKADSQTLSFAPTGSDPALMTFGDGGYTVSFGLDGAAKVSAVAAGTQATYTGILPSTDLELAATQDGLKEDLILHSASAPTVFTYPFTTTGGLTAKTTADGVSFVDARGVARVTVPNGIMLDSKIDPRSGQGAQSNGITYSIVDDNGGPALRMTLDAAWLADPARVFPVIVDPTTDSPFQADHSATVDTSTSPMGTYSGDLKTGSFDGVHNGASLVQYDGIANYANTKISAATLNLWQTYSSYCGAAEGIYVYQATGNWNVSSINSYPGVPYNGTLLGSTSTIGGSNCNGSQWDLIPLNANGISVLQSWAQGTSTDYGFLIDGNTGTSTDWKRYTSVGEGGVTAPSLTVTYSQDVPPQIDTAYPGNNAALSTLTPELLATGHDPDQFPNSSVTYDFQVYNSANTKVADSGALSTGDWTVPSGALKWGQSFWWQVTDYDGYDTSAPSAAAFSTEVPQPPITSALSQNSGGQGFDASVGDYTTESVDADVAGAGPALQIVRDYNSMDPRAGEAFGAAWSSVLDAKASEQYTPGGAVSSVNVTYPNGSEVGFGNNGDGTYAPPQGRFATFKQITGGYWLTDKNDSVYTFSQALGGGSYGITSIADANGRAITFAWSSGQITTVSAVVSGRALHLTWTTPSGATAAHVASVSTDPATAGQPGTALTWTYSYAGDQLTKVCSPVDTAGCTQYAYTSGSPFPAAVSDAAPHSYWRLGEATGTTAYSNVLINEGSDNAAYSGVNLGQPGPLNGTTATSAGFSGAGSVLLPNNLVMDSTNSSVGMWFKTTGSGTLFSTGHSTPGTVNPQPGAMPVLYVGTDGHLYGHYWNTTVAGVKSPGTVNDGNWHYVMLTSATSQQSLYLDGNFVGSQSGTIVNIDPYDMVGAGVYNANGWPAAWGGNSWNYFAGQISDVAYFTQPLTGAQISTLFQARSRSTSLLTGITRPSGKTFATVTYNPVSGTVSTVTDANGGTWTVGSPLVVGSSQVYRSAVLSEAPSAYWRLADSGGAATAYDQVAADGKPATYNNVSLGQPSAFNDVSAAGFNGTSSSVSVAGPMIDTSQSFSVSAWANLADTSTFHPVVVQANTSGTGYGFWLGYDHNLNSWAMTTTNSPTNPTAWYSAAGAAGSAQTGTWTHLVGTFDKTTGKLSLFINGVLQARQDVWPAPFKAPGPLDIGTAPGGWYLNGSASDVAVYPTALSAAQALQQYQAYKNSNGITNSGGIMPATIVHVLDPVSTQAKIPFDGTTYAASAAKTWTLSGARLVFQTDGNLVIYRADTNAAIWATGTNGHTGAVLAFQTNGDLAIYSDSTMSTQLWHSGTSVGSGNYALFQPDGSFLVDGSDTRTLWSFLSPVTDAADVISYVGDTTNGDRPISETSATGGVSTYGYDTSGFENTITDPDGNVTTTGHDIRGNTVSQTTCQVQSTNTCSTQYWTYWPDDVTAQLTPDARNDLPTSYRDGRSASAGDPTYATTYSYDAAGDEIAETGPPVAGFPDGRTTSIKYTDGTTVAAADSGYAPAGLAYKTTSPGGTVSTVSYLHSGDVASTTSAAGLAIKYGYDDLGRVLTKTEVSDSYPNGLVTSFAYNGDGAVTQQTDPATTDRVTGAVHTPQTTTVYDADGNVTSQTVADLTGGDALRTVTSTFNADDQMASAIDAAGSTTTFGYDAFGDKIKDVDGRGVETDTAFDADGHVLTQTLVGYTGDPANPSPARNLVESSRAYDPAGRLASLTDSMGDTTSYTYTDDGLLAKVVRTDPNGANPFVVQSNTYDAADNQISQTTNNGATVTDTSLDAASRVAAQTVDPTGVNRSTVYTYTPDDGIASEQLRDNTSGTNRTVTNAYDGAGRLSSQTVHAVSTSTAPAAAASLAGSWALNDGDVATAADASGSSDNGTLSGDVSWSTDHGGSAAFGGNGGDISAQPAVNTAASFSVSAWAKLTDTSTYHFVVGQSGANMESFYLDYDPPQKSWAMVMPGSDSSSPSWTWAAAPASQVQLNTWTHLVGEYDASHKTISLYVNGVLAGTGTNNSAWNSAVVPGSHLQIGGSNRAGSDCCSFAGNISGVKIYNRLLSTTEITALYSGPPGHQPQNGLAGQWNLTDGNVGTASDASGNNASGTLSGGVSWSADHNGSAVFDGTSGTIATAGPVVDTSKSYSVSAWVKINDLSTWHQIVSQDGTNGSGFYLLYDKSLGSWTFDMINADTSNPSSYPGATSSVPASVGTWTHLVGTYDQSTGKISIYVNGQLAGTGTNTAPWKSSGPLRIGAAKSAGAISNFFSGKISGVQVYSRALSATEVSSLYGGNSILPADTTTTTSWTYDQRGLPVSQTDSNGNTTTYVNDEAGHRVVTSAPAVATEVNGGSPVTAHPMTTVGFDSFGEAVETQDPDGNVTKAAYDADGRVTSSTMPTYTAPGSSTAITPVTSRTYDAGGDVVSSTDPLGNKNTSTYDQAGDLATSTDPNNGVTHYTYDTNGAQLSVTDASGAQSQTTYDYMGRKATSTTLERYPSAASFTTTYAYNSAGFLSQVKSPAGVTTGYGYDNVGEETSSVDGAGNTTHYTYDFQGNQHTTTAPDGTSTEIDYDAQSRPITAKSFDSLGTLLTQSSKTYDGLGNVLSSTDPRGATTTFGYDATGVLTSETAPVTASSSITTSFGYDAVGNQTRYTDGNGGKWTTTYNTWNQPESRIEPATATYSAASDSTFTTAYDADGRPVTQTQPGGVSISATYDALGDLTQQAGTGAEAATASRTFGYDAVGRMTSAATTAAGSASATSETFTYNDRGGLLTAAGSGGSSSFGYTADSLPSSRTDAAGTSTYGYDSADRLSTIADATTGSTLTYGYNTSDQVASIGYGSGGDTRSFGYDSLHQLASDTLKTSAGATVASIGYGYDADGNLTSKNTTGFGPAATNTYTYDLANRLTSWNNGTSTTAYSYDANGNRTQVGANVYTYDARDELTGDGVTSYAYTARGTLKSQSSTAGGTVTATFDAYGQGVTQGAATYTYDALGRTTADTVTGGANWTFAFSGAGNDLASDGVNRYSRDPSGNLVGVNAPGAPATSGVLAFTDLHTDVVGDFTATGSTLSGTAVYDPLGNTVGTPTKVGQLGYQQGWTESSNGRVNMASRWYNPATGQFISRDTAGVNPAPNAAAANPFAYIGDNPMIGTDPSGHCSWWTGSCEVSAVATGASAAWDEGTSMASDAWNWATDTASQGFDDAIKIGQKAWHYTKVVAKATYNAGAKIAVRTYRATTNFVADAYTHTVRVAKRFTAAANRSIKQAYHAAVHTVATAYHATVKAAKTAATFVKHHAAAIGSMVVSTVVFMGCEAVVGIPTGGAGAVAGAAGCGALAGMAGGLFDQGAKCVDGQKGACSAGSFAKSATIGAVGGAVGGAVAGGLGGKLADSVLGRFLPKVVTGAAEGSIFGGASGAAASATAYGLGCGSHCSLSGLGSATAQGAESGAIGGALGGAIGGALGSSDESTCHSFTAETAVLMADGDTKPISQIKIGDQIANAVPGQSGTQAHTVTNVIVTKTDHDFVDVGIKPLTAQEAANSAQSVAVGNGSGKTKTFAKAGLALAAALTAIAGAAATAQSAHFQSASTSADQAMVAGTGGTLTTTFLHPFYDRTQAAFTEAADLHVGDVLQTPTGAAEVMSLRLYHQSAVTYDLTIGDLHTYYVEAGDTPVLVHNCGTDDVVTAYRKQDTNIPQTQRLSVDAEGNISHSGSGQLYVNMTGDISHTTGFKGDQTIAFDVPRSYVDQIAGESLPQRIPKGWPGTKREWNQARKMAPDQSDGPGLFGLPDHYIPGLIDAIIPGSGRIVG